jgi:hypothetical protein
MQFPWPLPIHVEALGQIEKVNIGGYAVHLVLPVDSGGGEVGPPLDFRGAPLAHELERSQRNQWGYRSTQSLYYVSAASSSFLLRKEEKMYDSSDLKALGNAFVIWFRMVQEWASAWSHEPLRDSDRSYGSAVTIPTGDGFLTGSGGILSRVFFGAQALRPDQVSGAFRRASRGDRLPVEHLMLLSATEAQNDGDFRRVVIDAATAAEVALSSYIADHLRGRKLGSEFIDEMIKDANGLVNLHSLCTKLGGVPGVSKGKVREELANVRNHAAHRGRIPGPAEAEIARQHAEILVRKLRPLPAS